MTKNAWIKMIKEASIDQEILDLLASYLLEIDEARQILRNKGYGVAGTSILQQVKEVPNIDESDFTL